MKEKQVKILVVDDDQGVCDSLSMILAKKGYDVDARSSGRDALKLLKKSSFDVLLTDLKLPEMNGIELLQAARKIDSDLGVIIMTGFGEIASYLEAMDLGAAEYLNKPIKSDELDVIVKKVIDAKK